MEDEKYIGYLLDVVANNSARELDFGDTMDFDSAEELIEYLIDQGAMFEVGQDSNGDAIYNFNMKLLKDLHPDMYASIMEEVDQDLIHLYKLGLIDVEYDESLEAKFSLSEKGRELMLSGDIDDYILDSRED